MSGKHTANGDNEMTQTKVRILRAAAAKFSEKGYKGASIRLISAAAAVNVAAVNYYFGSKEQLYFETYRYIIETAGSHPNWFETVVPQFASFEEWKEYVGKLFRDIFCLALRRDKMLYYRRKMAAMELAQPSGCLKLLLEKYFEPMHAFVVRVLSPALPECDANELNIWAQFILEQVVAADRLVPPLDQLILFRSQTASEWLETGMSVFMDAIVGGIEKRNARLGVVPFASQNTL